MVSRLTDGQGWVGVRGGRWGREAGGGGARREVGAREAGGGRWECAARGVALVWECAGGGGVRWGLEVVEEFAAGIGGGQHALEFVELQRVA